MRLLHVITTISRGGAENQLVELTGDQVRRGFAVAVAYLKAEPYWAKHLRETGVRVEPLALSYYGSLRPAFRLRRLIDDFAPDLVHAHMPPAEVYTRLALLGLGGRPRLVITKHNDERFYPGPRQRLTR